VLLHIPEAVLLPGVSKDFQIFSPLPASRYLARGNTEEGSLVMNMANFSMKTILMLPEQ